MRAWLVGVLALSACQCLVPVEEAVSFDAGARWQPPDAGVRWPPPDAGLRVPPGPFVPLNDCDWDWRATVRDGGAPAWALDGPTCALFLFPDAGFDGTFATREACEATCPCDASKLSGDFPACDAAFVTWADGGANWFAEVEWPGYGIGPADMAELCRRSFDEALVRAECVVWE